MNECLILAKSRKTASLCSTGHTWPHDQIVTLVIPSFHVLQAKLSTHFHTGPCEDSPHNGSSSLPCWFDY